METPARDPPQVAKVNIRARISFTEEWQDRAVRLILRSNMLKKMGVPPGRASAVKRSTQRWNTFSACEAAR